VTGEPGADNWLSAAAAAALFAVDPQGTGGIRLRALPGPARDAWMALVRELLDADKPYRRIPNHIRDDRLLGGLDLTATLESGRPIRQRGVLAESDGGVVELVMAERMDPGLAARICSVLDAGEVVLERDGITSRMQAHLGVIAIDEGLSADEVPPAALLDRLAFVIDLTGLSWRDTIDSLFDAAQTRQARQRLPQVTCPAEMTEVLAATGLALGVWSLRPAQLAVRVARAAAALDGRDCVQQEDVSLAARLVLAPRATRVPAAPEAEEDAANPPEQPPDEPETPPPPPDADDEVPSQAPTPEDIAALGETVLQAALATIPADLLMQLSQGTAAGSSRGAGGRAGSLQRSRHRGRPIGIERGDPASGARLSVLDTLRAAAPWQPLRRSMSASTPARAEPRQRVSVRSEDFRVVRFRQRQATTTIFLVDASGSAALDRLAEAKGAVELLLADCYVRRDEVALIAFRGSGAELLLPPTRSLVRAKRELAGLPGGGGTPLAAGLDAARALVEQIARQGNSAVLVVLTDGRANVARNGQGGRGAAHADALASARALQQQNITSVVIDLSRKPQPKAEEIAQALAARYLLLPAADAATLSNAVRILT
jgi:magnesium chelatase subunit D